MELIATKGATNATSYTTTDEADDYLEFLYGADEWSEQKDDQKEQLLITATKTLDRFNVMFPKLNETQALKFPANTYNRTDRAGNKLGDGFDKAKEATIFQALYLLKHGEEIEEAKAQRVQVIKSYKIGPHLSKEMSGFNPLGTLAPEALTLLSPYLFMQTRAVR